MADNQPPTPGTVLVNSIRRGGSPLVLPGNWVVPCAGEAPANLDSHQPVLRDCSPPDPEKLSTEKQIVRP